MTLQPGTIEQAMRRALTLAASPEVPTGPNPRVGCVLLDSHGAVLAEGYHRGAGTPHAEVDALTQAGQAARGAIAVVTLEPCNHTGRTGPCAQALIAAGISEVHFAQADPNREASGGAETLRAAGIAVHQGPLTSEARAINEYWSFAHEQARPFVTWKFASGLDGRSAASDLTSQWITGPAARRDVHRLRAACDAVMVGTGTVLADDPALTVRDDAGAVVGPQPLRVVVGQREIPAGRRVLDEAAETLVLTDSNPDAVLRALADRGVQRVLLEGGPTLASAFLQAGLVDEVIAYIAPVLLGAGLHAVADLGVTTISEAVRLDVVDVAVLGPDVRITARTSQKEN